MSGEVEKRASDVEREQVVLRLRDVGSDKELPPVAPLVHIRAFRLIGEVKVVRS